MPGLLRTDLLHKDFQTDLLNFETNLLNIDIENVPGLLRTDLPNIDIRAIVIFYNDVSGLSSCE